MSKINWEELTFVDLVNWQENTITFKVNYKNKNYLLKVLCGLSKEQLENFTKISKITLDNICLQLLCYLKSYGQEEYNKLENVLQNFSLDKYRDNIRLCKQDNNFIFLLLEEVDNTLNNLKTFSVYLIIELYLVVYLFLINKLIPTELDTTNIGVTILQEDFVVSLETTDNKTTNFIIPKGENAIKIINYGLFPKFARHNIIMHHDVLGKLLNILQYINDHTTDKTLKQLIGYLRDKKTYKLKALDVLTNIVTKLKITTDKTNYQKENIIIKKDDKILSKTQYSNITECLNETDIKLVIQKYNLPVNFIRNYNNINNFPYLEISCKLKDTIIKEMLYQWKKLSEEEKGTYYN